MIELGNTRNGSCSGGRVEIDYFLSRAFECLLKVSARCQQQGRKSELTKDNGIGWEHCKVGM
jgi:hypothetical protein